MISNVNKSGHASGDDLVTIKKYIGVGSVKVLAINPANKTLREYGWSIPDGAEEPSYSGTDSEGRKQARVRFLVQVQELQEKPVIGMDFWVRPDVRLNSDSSKCEIIDAYGRTAWATKDEVKSHQVPKYSNGLANISKDYKPCHQGEEEIVRFLKTLLNITPYQYMRDGKWVLSKNPGTLTIDNWQKICDGDVTELREYVSLLPDNQAKVVFGVRTTDENKAYQTFLNTRFFGNGSKVDMSTGEFTSARKEIDKFVEARPNTPVSFSARPVQEWKVTATEVTENTGDMPESFSDTSYFESNPDDLPFDD